MESCTGESEVPCRSLVKVSHRISTGILETAREEQCNFIVIARQKNPGTVDRIFSSLIDTVLQKAPSEVAVLHGHFDPGHVKRIMIPYAENVHTNLATEIAPALKETFQADLQVAFVLNPDDPRDVSDQRLEKVREQVRETLPGARIKAVCARDILAGVVEASRGADMLLMAAAPAISWNSCSPPVADPGDHRAGPLPGGLGKGIRRAGAPVAHDDPIPASLPEAVT